MSKIKDPPKLKKLNEAIGLYGGLYAKWRSSGFKNEMPQELIDQIMEIDEAVTNFLVGFGE